MTLFECGLFWIVVVLLTLMTGDLISQRVFRQKNHSLVYDFASGWCTWTILAFVLAHLGLLFSFVFVFLALVIVFLNRTYIPQLLTQFQNLKRAFTELKTGQKGILIFLIAFVGPWFLQSPLPEIHVDPLYYHLPSAWMWSTAGKFFLPEWNPWVLQGGLVEYFYTAIASIVRDRFKLLILCQMLSATAGYLFSPMIFYQIARRLLPMHFALMATFAFVSFPINATVLICAKNDAFLLFTSLVAFDQLIRFLVDRRHQNLIGFYFFCVIAFSIKHVAMFFVIPAFIVLWANEIYSRKLTMKHLLLVAGAILGMLVIPFRNFYFSGDPFFPAFGQFFHSQYLHPYNISQAAGFTRKQGTLWEIITSQLGFYVFPRPIFIVGVALTFVAVRNNRSLRIIASLGLLAFTLLCLITGQGVLPRFALFLYAIIALCTFISLRHLGIRYVERGETSRKVFSVGVFLLLFINCQFEMPLRRLYRRVVQLSEFNFSVEAFAREEIPQARLHAWANENLPPHSKILSNYENNSYFLDLPLAVPENEAGAARVKFAKNYDEAIKIFREEKFTHCQLSEDAIANIAVLSLSPKFKDDFKFLQKAGGMSLYEYRVH